MKEALPSIMIQHESTTPHSHLVYEEPVFSSVLVQARSGAKASGPGADDKDADLSRKGVQGLVSGRHFRLTSFFFSWKFVTFAQCSFRTWAWVVFILKTGRVRPCCEQRRRTVTFFFPSFYGCVA